MDKNIYSLVSKVLAFCVLLIALSIMLGWIFHIDQLIQLKPSFVPVQFNAAFCIALISIVLVFNDSRFAIPLRVVLAAAYILAALTLIEYITGIDLGIDELFIQHYITVLTETPGRMAPNTAIGIILIAMASHVLLLPEINSKVLYRTLSLTFTTLGLSIVALFGYLTDFEMAYGWGNMTRMALLTASCIFVLSCAISLKLISHKVSELSANALISWGGIPLAVTVAVCLQMALTQERDKNLQLQLEEYTELLAFMLKSELDWMGKFVQTMSLEWTGQSSLSPEGGSPQFQFFNVEIPAVISFEWIDHDYNTLYRKPDQPLESISEFNLFSSSVRSRTLNSSRNWGYYYSSPVTLNDGTRAVYLISPVNTSNGHIGWVLAIIDLKKVMSNVFESLDIIGIAVDVFHSNGSKIIEYGEHVESPKYRASILLDLENDYWALMAHTNYQFDVNNSRLLNAIASSLTIVTIFLLLIVTIGLARSREQKKTIKTYLEKKNNLFDAMLDGILVIDKRGLIKDVNRTALVIFGYRRDELLDRHVKLLLPTRYSHEFDKLVSAFESGGVTNKNSKNRQFDAVRKDRKEFKINLQISRGFYLDQVFFTAVFHDLTDVLAKEELIAEKEALLNTSIKALTSGFIMSDENLKVIEVNDALENMLSMKREDILNQSMISLLFGNVVEGQALFNEILSGEKTMFHREELITSKSNAKIWVLISVSSVKNDRGKVQYVVASVADIDRIKKLENQNELKRKALAASNAELEQFAYVASHDLKEPVRTVLAFSEHLRKDVESNRSERIEQDLNFISKAAQRMSALVDDLLALSRVGVSGNYDQEFSLNDIVAENIDSLSGIISERNVDIEVGELPIIKGNSHEISRVFLNLLSNAIKYSSEDRKPKISIQDVSDENCQIITVEDNGSGFHPEQIKDAFLPFKRFETGSHYTGTGMGLAIVKKIMERHGGKVEITSVKDEGSCFYLKFKPRGAE